MKPLLVIASGNRHKVLELTRMLQSARIDAEVKPMQELGQPPEIPETAPDFKGNAKLKSEGIAAWVAQCSPTLVDRAWVLADDSGLCVQALDGAPGVYSARYSGPDATDATNNAKLVAELKARGLDRSPAYFCCALALSAVHSAGVKTITFEGKASGEARVEPAGDGGFGYDPHVWIDGQQQSFAQMSAEAKAQLSHRGQALQALLHELPGILAAGP